MKLVSFAMFLGIALILAGVLIAVALVLTPSGTVTSYPLWLVYPAAVIGGTGLALIARVKVVRGETVGAVLVTAGTILVGFTLFESIILKDEFEMRCFEEVGCSVALARSSVSDAFGLGILLAIGTLLLGCGLSLSKKREP